MNVARRCSIAVLLVIAIGLGGGLIAEASPRGAYGHLPLSFEANRGQTDPSVEFVARSAGYQFFLTEEEAVLVLRRPGALAADTLRLTLVGAHPRRPVGVESLPGTVNYLVGSDPAAWRTAIPTYAKVRVPGVYPGVDLVYYGHGRQIEYDFIVGPGADPAAIRLRARGLARGPELDLSLRESGDLAIRVPGGEVMMKRPVAYQTDDAGVRTRVDAAYVLLGSPDDGGRQVGFAIGPYDRDRRLVIDPVVSYATYLGGTLEDAGLAIAHRDGHVYVTGYTDSVNFPPPGGAQNNQLGQDAFVAKLDAAGTGLVYATYVGGSGEDAGVAIAVDAAGQAYVTGYTDSTNFPRVPATPLFGDQGGRDAFVVKLNAAGSGFLYATYLGGGAEDHGLGIAVDASGSALVTGWTDSGDFPTTPSTAFQGDQLLRDAFVTQISPAGTALLYSTYLGGDGDDEAHAVAVDASGRIHVTGGSNSANLPRTANSRLPAGGQDAFVATFNPSAAGAASLTFLTYFGGSGEDAGRGIAVDSAGLIYFTGSTASPNFPTRASTAYQSAPGGGEDAFVAKLNPAGLGPNTVMMYSSLLGGSGHEAGYGLALDEEGQAYVTGFTTSANFPTRHAVNAQLGGARDAFVAKFDPLGVGDPSLRYSTYLGGSGDDEGFGIGLDAAGNAYVVGLTRSANFPEASGSLSGPEDAFVARLSEPDIVISTVTAPATAGDGGQIEVSAVTRNAGAVEAGGSTTSFYLSPDNRLNPSLDTRLGSYEVPKLAAGQEHTPELPLTVTLPTGLPPATYFLFASADDADAVGESFESNNKTKREIAIGPDATVSSFSVSTFGTTMTVTDITRNAGGAALLATTTKFFLVTPGGEVLLGSRPVSTLAGGAATEATETAFPIPAGTAAGSHTVIARADADNVVVETSEINNSRSAPFDLGVDLIVATLGGDEFPSTAGAGMSFVIRTTITNRGFVRSVPSTTEFFLSPTAELDPAAPSIGTRATPALDPGQTSTTLSTTLTIPAATAPGPYFVVAKANGGPSPIAETRTTNNTRARATVIGPDLLVTFVSPSTITTGPGGKFIFKDTTRNLGGGVAAASVTKFHLSPDAVYDATDVELGQRAVRALNPREQDFNSAGVELTVPQSTTAGTYFVIARANAGPTPIGETNPTNNTLTASLNLAGIDLVVSSLTVALGAGSTVNITDVTKNEGTTPAGESVTRFHFSTDAVFDATTDPVLGSRSVGALGPGATSEASTSWPLPAGTAPGTYTIFAVADANGTVAEANESNNRRARGLDTQGSDLVPTALLFSWGQGPILKVTDTTRNEGPSTAGASTTRVYLSADATLNVPGDTPLGPGRSVVSLAAANQSTAETSVTIPAVTAAGDYFLIARVDDANAVGEVNETNNTLAKFISIRPDLAFSTVSVPGTALPGATIAVSGKIINNGPIPVGTSIVRVFMSTDETLDAGDPAVGTATVGGLGPNDPGDFNIQVQMPSVGETRYLFARIDPDNQIVESDETNNDTRARAVALGADLSISLFSGPNPSVAGAGSAISLRDRTVVRVADVTVATTTGFYLSPDDRFDRGVDVELGRRAVPPLGAGRTSEVVTPVTIPAGTASRQYFIIAVADVDLAVSEGNETNNTASFSIVIGPDLKVSAVSAPAVAASSTPLSVTDTTVNQGGADAGASMTKLYLSANTTWEPTDVLLGSREVGGLAAGASSSGATADLVIPSNTVAGTYHIVARADSNGQVDEVDEGNNTTASGPILIGADLTVNLSVPTTALPGAIITIADTVNNIGGAVAGQSVVRIYVSTDAELSPGTDTLLSSRVVPSLAGGATSVATTPFTVPAETPPNGLFIIAQVDATDQVVEISDANNVLAAPVKTGPDLQVTILTVPPEGAPGGTITLKDTTKNFGARTGRLSVTRYFFSVDAVLDAGDILLASRDVGDLAFGGSSLGTLNGVQLPNVLPGTYHIIAQADATNALDEAFEDNNTQVKPISLGADYIIGAVSGPTASGAGKQIEVGASTKNQGAATTIASVTQIFLSTDEEWHSGDRLLGSIDVLPLGANATRSGSTTVTIPANAGIGRHFIIARANGTGTVGDVNPDNNTRARPIDLGPDLVIPTFTVQTTGGASLPFRISDTVRNDGEGDAPASVNSYFLSLTGELDSASTFIGSRNVPVLLPGASNAGEVHAPDGSPLTLPPGLVAGSYLVFAVANSGGLPELSVQNNTKSKQTKIGPDLVVSTLTSPSAAAAGATITATATIVNQGAGHAGTFAVRAYLVAEGNGPPVEVGSIAINGGLAPDASSGARAISVRVPSAISGTFTLAVVADADNAVSEISEVNNQKTRSLSVNP